MVNLGGAVLASPRVVPVTYDGDPMRANIEAFVAAIGASEFWKTAVAEYGVGPAASGRPVHLAETAAASIDDDEVRAWLAAKLDGSHGDVWDPPDGSTMYVVYLPPGTTYTLHGATGCKGFYASDQTLTVPDAASTAVPYVVVPRCPPLAGLDDWDTLSSTTSHELVEESTDPFKIDAKHAAWFTDDPDHVSWSFAPPFSEIADMCSADATAYVHVPDVDGAVQRVWSNAAAAAGKNPCVPAPAGQIYFNAAPVLLEDVPISFAGWSSTTKGVRVPVGETRSVELDLFSEAPTPAWSLKVVDWATALGGAPELAFALDRDHGANGDKLSLALTRLRPGAIGGSRFLVYSYTPAHAVTFWIGYAGN